MSLEFLAKMNQKTSNANNMQGSKEYFLRVKEEEYFDLPQALRERCTVYYNDYELYRDNPSFKALNKAYRDSKKALENWKYDQRHN